MLFEENNEFSEKRLLTTVQTNDFFPARSNLPIITTQTGHIKAMTKSGERCGNNLLA